jgi:uncharacterized membrane protein
MKKVIPLICICFLVGYAKQNKIDIGLNFGRDFIAYPFPIGLHDDKVDFSPKTVNLLITSPINNILEVGLKTGYSFRTNEYCSKAQNVSSRHKYWLNGGYVQILGLANVPLTEKLSTFMGVGVGFNYYVSNYGSYYSYGFYTYQYATVGITQAFLLGSSIAISKNAKLMITFEKLGFNNLKYQYDIFNGEGEKVGEYNADYIPQSGFDDVGITMGVTYTL